MKKVLLPILIPAFLAVLTACSGDDYGAVQSDLNRNLALWESQGFDQYSMQYAKVDGQVSLYETALVQGGVVTSAYDEVEKSFVPDGQLQNSALVHDMFDVVQEAIDREADHLLVIFNEDYGYPEKVFVNFDYGEDFDEVSYQIYEFASGVHIEAQYKLDIALEKWQPEYIEDYSYKFSLSCFCLPLGVVDVVVEQEAIVSATNSEDAELSPEEIAQILTIQDLFNIVQNSIDNEVAELNVEFDPEFGIPLSVSLDNDALTTDDEYSYSVSDFQFDPLIANQNKLIANESVWMSQDISTYQYGVSSNTLQEDIRYYIYVEDGVGENGAYRDQNNELVEFDPVIFLDYITVEDYFSLVQNAIDSAADISVTYSKSGGYPVDIQIDYSVDVADDDVEFSIRKFKYYK